MQGIEITILLKELKPQEFLNNFLENKYRILKPKGCVYDTEPSDHFKFPILQFSKIFLKKVVYLLERILAILCVSSFIGTANETFLRLSLILLFSTLFDICDLVFGSGDTK